MLNLPGLVQANVEMTNRLGRGYSFEVLRAKTLLAYGAHKREEPRFSRSASTMSLASFVRQGGLLGVDISTLTDAVAAWPLEP